MRLLFVTPYYYPELKFGGPPQKMHSLARGLAARGHHAQVLTFHSEHPRWRKTSSLDGVGIQYLPWLGRGMRQLPLAWDTIRSATVDAELVHLYGLYDFLGPMVARQCRKLKRPFVLEPLGMYVPRARNVLAKRCYHRLFTSRMARSAAALVAASSGEREDLRPLANADRIVIRPNGVDLDSFSKLPDRIASRQKLGIGAGESLILYLGRLSPIKNLEQLISAFARFTGPTRLVLAGPGNEPDYAARLAAQVQDLGLGSRVSFPGALFAGEKLAALAAADLFVLPSLSESFGNAAAEAVAAGLPVLLTNTCGIAPLIHERAGLAVPLGVESLATGLRTMLDPERCRELTARRAEVLGELSWDEPIRQTEQLYLDILARGRVGAGVA